MDAPAAPAAAGFKPIALALARRALGVVGLALALGLLFSLIFPGGAPRVMVFTACISIGCWFFVDGGRALAARLFQRNPAAAARGWPGWGWMSASIVFGTLAGYFSGTWAAAWMLGARVPNPTTLTPAGALPTLVISVVIGCITTYVFWSRHLVSAADARAQQAQREAAENQLRLLQSQLEPHMLFNTLANLRVLIGVDPPRAQAMLDALIAFLRATLEASRAGSHPLATEFARCADYLALMQVRMGPRLRSSLDLPEALASVPVPPLLLQPLVENAIRHGLEPKVEGGEIAIGAARDGADLVLTVRDSGVGLDHAVPSDGTRFGLAQVRERLATLYGDRAAFTLAPGADGGAVATLRLPMPA